LCFQRPADPLRPLHNAVDYGGWTLALQQHALAGRQFQHTQDGWRRTQAHPCRASGIIVVLLIRRLLIQRPNGKRSNVA
jgi:hypothetical protein